MELHLDRALQENACIPPSTRCFQRPGENCCHPDEWERVLMRKTMAALPPLEAMEKLIDNLHATKTN